MATQIIPIIKWPDYVFILLLMVTVGVFSSFVATTAVVIIFIKLISELDKLGKIEKKKVLLPISFAGIMGGSCTLMGTSTNLIVAGISNKSGVGRFSFFEFSAAGVVFMLVAIPVIYLLAKRLAKSDNTLFANTFFALPNIPIYKN